MCAGKLDVCAANSRHTQEIVSSGNKRSESGGKRNPALCGQADGRSHHVLLGDEALEEAVGESLLELLGVRGVLYISVEHDNTRIRFSDGRESVSKGSACCDVLFSRFVRRR